MRPLSGLDYLVLLTSVIVLIVGGYQFYFFVQDRHRGLPKEFFFLIDEMIPFWPSWVWIYSGLYYPVIILLTVTIRSFAQFNYTVFSFLVLLVTQIAVFFFFPVKTPDRWRNYDPKTSLSTRFLSFVHSYDGLSNSIPSMHVSVATLTACHLHSNLTPEFGSYGEFSYLFPVLIAASASFTKQHYFIDLPAGALIGYLNFLLYQQMFGLN